MVILLKLFIEIESMRRLHGIGITGIKVHWEVQKGFVICTMIVLHLFVIRRDLKSSNILLDEDYEKIAEFGVARFA